jgi:hypothetical protein
VVEDFSAVLPIPLMWFRPAVGKINRLVMDDRDWGGFGRLWNFEFTRLP